MGTNYYIQKAACPTCHHEPEREHVGKSSCGWAFAFDARTHKTMASWVERLTHLAPGEWLMDEYGGVFLSDTFLADLAERAKQIDLLHSHGGQFHKVTHDSGHDFCDYEFS